MFGSKPAHTRYANGYGLTAMAGYVQNGSQLLFQRRQLVASPLSPLGCCRVSEIVAGDV